VSGEHDELLFIVVHQAHELWFKELLHELAELQRQLVIGESFPALRTLQRALAIVRVVISQIDVIETLTARQFAAFRSRLGTSSGFQSAQFREIEAVLGRRDSKMLQGIPERADRDRVEAAMNRPSVFDSLLAYLDVQGYQLPADGLYRNVRLPAQPTRQVQDVLLRVYCDDAAPAQVCELLVSLDESLQEWRYRHIKMVERIIGARPGTGGSTGAAYLYKTITEPAFPDLWAMRSRL